MTGARKVGEDEDTGEEIFAPHIIWGTEHVKVTATEAMQAEAEGGHSKHARNEASEFLQSRLAGAPVMADDLREEGEANGISWRTSSAQRRNSTLRPRRNEAALAESGSGRSQPRHDRGATTTEKDQGCHGGNVGALGALQRLPARLPLRGNNVIYSRKAAKDAKKPTPGILVRLLPARPHAGG